MSDPNPLTSRLSLSTQEESPCNDRLRRWHPAYVIPGHQSNCARIERERGPDDDDDHDPLECVQIGGCRVGVLAAVRV